MPGADVICRPSQRTLQEEVGTLPCAAGILTSLARPRGAALSRFRVKPALLFGCAPAERIRQPSRQVSSGNPNEICASPNLMLLLKRHSRRQSSVTKRPAIANKDETNTGGLSC